MSKLIILTGLSFAGKTTLGKEIIKKFDFESVDVDITKEQLFDKGLRDDNLTHEQWVKIYDETDRQIEKYLKEGKSVVDDSRNFRKFERTHAKEIADKCGSGFITIYVNTPKEVVKQRLHINRANQMRHDVEDKDFEEILSIFEPPTEDENALTLKHGEDINDWLEKHSSQLKVEEEAEKLNEYLH